MPTNTDPLDLNRAICRGMDESESDAIFFPNSDKPEAFEPAKAICLNCPVREACLDMALSLSVTDGMFGGLDPRERRALARKRGRRIKHGTSTGYQECVKRPQGSCNACRAANAARKAAAKAKRTEQRTPRPRSRDTTREHGTHRGIQQHRYYKEPLCSECFEANRTLSPLNCKPIKHGTNAGYQAHKRRNQPACDACRAAHNQAAAERLARRKAEAAA